MMTWNWRRMCADDVNGRRIYGIGLRCSWSMDTRQTLRGPWRRQGIAAISAIHETYAIAFAPKLSCSQCSELFFSSLCAIVFRCTRFLFFFYIFFFFQMFFHCLVYFLSRNVFFSFFLFLVCIGIKKLKICP